MEFNFINLQPLVILRICSVISWRLGKPRNPILRIHDCGCLANVHRLYGVTFSNIFFPLCKVKTGVNAKAVFRLLNTAFLPISRSRFKRH